MGAAKTRRVRGSITEVTAGDRPRVIKAAIRSSNNVSELYSWIRAAILNGKMAADQPISQAKLAVELGVSRTPLREALRMLQAEGLVVGELNQRMRVASLTAEGIDSLYASRIMLESFGLALTIPRLSKAELARIQQTLKYMNAHHWTGDRAAWEVHHNAFHGLLVMHVGTVLGPTMAETIANFQLRAERYRRLYVQSDPNASAIAAQDHARIVEAVGQREPNTAVARLAEHLSRTALRLLADRASNFEPKALKNALALVTRSDGSDIERMRIAAGAELLASTEQPRSEPLNP